MCIGLISLLLLHGCAVARSLHTAAVNGGAKDTETMDVQEVLRRGESYYHYLLSYAFQLRNDLEEHLVQAIGEMQEALKQQPESVFLQTELARLQMRRGDMTAALRACQQAIALAPDHAPAHLLLGAVYVNLQKKEEAKAAFRKAIALDPLQEDGYLYLGT